VGTRMCEAGKAGKVREKEKRGDIKHSKRYRRDTLHEE